MHCCFAVVAASLVGLAGASSFEDLLGSKTGAPSKKGAIKASLRPASAAGAGRSGSRLGLTRQLTIKHMGDGQPLHLEMQVT